MKAPAPKTRPAWKHKDLLGLESLSALEIEQILKEAEACKKDLLARKSGRQLDGSTLAFVFTEPSTRTRTSFEVAARRLGVEVLGFAAAGSSTLKGETLTDTLLNLEAMGVDFFVIRNEISGILETIAPKVRAHIVNAGDGWHEHPTQALLDLFTLKERKKRIEGLKVVIVGDILHSRVARSNIWGLKKLKARVTVCGPPTLIPPDIDAMGVNICYELVDALHGADAVNVLRIQSERQQENLFPSLAEYFATYGLTWDKLAKAEPDCLVLHPGPMNRGVEIASDVADGPQSVILDQVTNGVAVRMAVLKLLAQRGQT